jgi:endoglycosylceramidase
VALAVGAVLLAPGSTASAADPPAAPPAADHPLHVAHGPSPRIVDDLGRTVLLRGVNVNALGEYYQEWPDLPSTRPLGDADDAAIAAHGFDVVRLVVSWSRIEPERGHLDPAYLALVRQQIERAGRHGLHVVVDLHQDAWGIAVGTPDGVTCPAPLQAAVGWDGAPAWATQLVGTVATCRAVMREVSAAVQASFQAFYLDVGGVQGELVRSWAALAGAVADLPNVAGYDLLNEPNPGLALGVDDLALLGTFYGRAITAIRAAERATPHATAHLVFFEPSVLTGPLATPGPLPGFSRDPDLVYAPHLYDESISPLPGTIEQGFANAATAARTYGTPFWSGEWGWFGDPAADAPKITRYAAAEDRALVGGAWWQWSQACGDPHNVQLRHVRPACAATGKQPGGLVAAPASTLRILDRAYPRAAPGTLTSIHADIPSGRLSLTGQADRPGVPADLWVPARCAAPEVTGSGLGPSTVTAVPGGARLSVVVPEPGPYAIDVTCAAPSSAASAPPAAVPAGPATGRRTLPATGAASRGAAAAGLLLVALVLTALRRRASGTFGRPPATHPPCAPPEPSRRRPAPSRWSSSPPSPPPPTSPSRTR